MKLPVLATLLAAFDLAVGARQGSAGAELQPRRLEPPTTYQFALDTDRTRKLLRKRESFNGRGSFYEAGTGACGVTNSDSDYIVALNFDQYGDTSAISPYCFKTITISYGGKTAQAQIVDACQACGWGGIDLTPALFQHFASESVGIIYLDRQWLKSGVCNLYQHMGRAKYYLDSQLNLVLINSHVDSYVNFDLDAVLELIIIFS